MQRTIANSVSLPFVALFYQQRDTYGGKETIGITGPETMVMLIASPLQEMSSGRQKVAYSAEKKPIKVRTESVLWIHSGNGISTPLSVVFRCPRNASHPFPANAYIYMRFLIRTRLEILC